MQGLSASLLVMLFLTACSSLSDNQQMALATQANQPLICQSGSDCDAKWMRAQQWVHDNSAYDIQAAGENLIHTDTPSAVSSKSGFTITRQATEKGHAIISFASGCGAMVVCSPSALELKASFVTFVSGGPMSSGQPDNSQPNTRMPVDRKNLQ